MAPDPESGRMRPQDPAAACLEEVRAAVTRGDWDGALELLRAAGPERSAEALELTAQAAYGAGDLEGAIAALEELHRLHLAAGDTIAAAHAAVMVALYLLIDTGLMTPVRGWLRRAENLLREAGETSVEAWIALVRTYERLLTGDLEAAAASARDSVALGTRFGIPPAVAIGRIALARVEILRGHVEAGLEMLDEIAVTLTAGELDALTAGMIYCELICAMQGLAQFDRAEQWTEAMERWRVGHAFGGLHGRCRVHRAEILRLRGPIDAAEKEAVRACEEVRPWMRREFGWPLTELGNIRLRKGDLAGAEEAYLAAHEHVWEPQPGLALLRLAQGDVACASRLIREALDHPLAIPSKERPPFGALRRAPLLDAQVEIALAVGDSAVADAAAQELTDVARDFHSEGLTAAATLARARVALAAGDTLTGVRESAAAVAAWTRIGAPYETAVARMVFADASQAAGNEQSARLERQAAQAMLRRLGARVGAPTAGPRDEAPEQASVTPACVFRREGRLRHVVFGGVTAQLLDLKGMRYLEILFAHPGREFHVLDLVALEAGSSGHGPLEDAPASYESDVGPIIDKTARDAYRRRLREIEEDVEDAIRNNDPERRALAEADRDYLVRELARSFGLGGRPRSQGAPSERARSAVTRTINYAVSRLAEQHPGLAEHLGRALHTGAYVRYEPDPLASIHWDTAPQVRCLARKRRSARCTPPATERGHAQCRPRGLTAGAGTCAAANCCADSHMPRAPGGPRARQPHWRSR